MPAPALWKSEFQVNTGTAAAGTQTDPQVIGLANGNFLVAWTEAYDGTVAAEAGSDIVGRIYDARGKAVTQPLRLNQTSTGHDEDDFDIAATSDGGFMLVYVENDRSTDTVIWERFDADGRLTASRKIVTESESTTAFLNPQISVDATDDSSYVTFTDYVSPDHDISGVRLDGSGTIVTPEFEAGRKDGEKDFDAEVAVLANGNMVSVFEEADGTLIGVEFRIATSSGVEVAAGQLDNGGGANRPAYDPKVAALANGNFVATWRDGSTPGDVLFSIYTSAGTAVGALRREAAATDDDENEPQIVATPDGGFFILWDNDTEGTLEGAKYAADGTMEGSIFQITSDGDERSPGVGVTGDGRLLVTWLRDGEVFVEIWDPRGSSIEAADTAGAGRIFVGDGGVLTARPAGGTVIGDHAGETLIGSDHADTLRGNGGADVLQGNGGADNLQGGAGNDSFTWANGDGSDKVLGGDGYDTLHVALHATSADTVTVTDEGTGFDLARSNLDRFTIDAASIERLVIDAGGGNDILSGAGASVAMKVDGGAGADIISTGAAKDTVSGGGGGDTLRGGGANDVLRGKSGADRIFGEAGNDKIFGDNGADRLDGGAGKDTIKGGGSADILLGGSSHDTLSGGNGSDDLKGGAGDDTLDGGEGNDRLSGGSGGDTLTGGKGADEFVLAQTSKVDVITDFETGTDMILLDSAHMAGLDARANGLLVQNQFTTGGNATTADHRLMYSNSNGKLFYDADGTGAAARVQIALLDPGLGLGSSDFEII
ncbi:calcium-binding protein [Tropicimonas sediminicola]|uniref:Ca2+-binding protein, RTX toxin-related n=1 Tax=Tropicimonas sediminicola TaxID=1031541 RepID=A0A239KHS1_9RHOB|nr:calcium-binding protein [Tropicimonas sediminicola]SNT17540.1 Ca2+-binding protein, RTX toxin-related [Tropicimonas sediminicola]